MQTHPEPRWLVSIPVPQFAGIVQEGSKVRLKTGGEEYIAGECEICVLGFGLVACRLEVRRREGLEL